MDFMVYTTFIPYVKYLVHTICLLCICPDVNYVTATAIDRIITLKMAAISKLRQASTKHLVLIVLQHFIRKKS